MSWNGRPGAVVVKAWVRHVKANFNPVAPDVVVRTAIRWLRSVGQERRGHYASGDGRPCRRDECSSGDLLPRGSLPWRGRKVAGRARAWARRWAVLFAGLTIRWSGGFWACRKASVREGVEIRGVAGVESGIVERVGGAWN